jgi:hypothetical protein
MKLFKGIVGISLLAALVIVVFHKESRNTVLKKIKDLHAK